MSDTSQYIHGTTAEEQSRLSLLNDLLNTRSVAEMRLHSEQRILDVGSGLGQLTRAMARSVTTGATVIGIERSLEQMREAQRQAALDGEAALVEFRQGDALNFPLLAEEWGNFDFAHTRFLLEHVPNPVEIVQSMVRAVRAGGAHCSRRRRSRFAAALATTATFRPAVAGLYAELRTFGE